MGFLPDFRPKTPKIRDLRTHPKSRNTKKKTQRSHELFRKVRANFCLLPCDTRQELKRNCSEILVQMIFSFWVNFSGGFSLAPRTTGRRSHWTERGDNNIVFTIGHCGAFVASLAANGLIVMAPSCANSLYPSVAESWEEMTKTEPRNKMLYSPGSSDQ